MSLNESGFELIDNFISLNIAAEILAEVDSALLANKGGGIRNADKKFSAVSTLASSDAVLTLASKYLTGRPRLVRAILFDKNVENNWLVSWHQDKIVALSNRFNDSTWGPWSLKDGVHHVQPPREVVDDMLAVRIHLDDSTLENGCLKVIAGSHTQGLLSQGAIAAVAGSNKASLVEAKALSALAMRPHILHASSKALKPSRRRVLHLEYSSYALPAGIHWA